jgi:transcriptional regulator with XRE-family HTH domain
MVAKEMTTMTTIAQNISSYRTRTNMTQQQVADKLNVSNHTISKWELGINTPSVEDMQKLAQVFGVTITELVVDKPVIKDFLELLSLGENMPENELPKLVEESYEQVLRERHLKPNSEGKQA